LNNLFSPVLYHQAGKDTWVTPDDIEQLRGNSTEYGKRVQIHLYPEASQAFCNEMKPSVYNPESSTLAWERTASFLKACFQGT
jgi:carboxymethylenebutenolidase